MFHTYLVIVVYYLFCIVQYLVIAELKAKQLIEHKTIKDKSDFIRTHTKQSFVFYCKCPGYKKFKISCKQINNL